MKLNFFVGDSSVSTELARLRSILTEHKTQIAALKEDNSRKSKLLSTLKEAKTAEGNALEHWKAECKENEESNKR